MDGWAETICSDVISGHSTRCASSLIPIGSTRWTTYHWWMKSDAVYWRRRASEEYLAANNAGPSVAFRAHRAMAVRYSELADTIEAEEQSLDATAESATEPATETDLAQRVTLWV